MSLGRSQTRTSAPLSFCTVATADEEQHRATVGQTRPGATRMQTIGLPIGAGGVGRAPNGPASKPTAPSTSAHSMTKEPDDMASLRALEEKIDSLRADMDRDRDQVRELVATDGAEMQAYARGLSLKSARAFLRGSKDTHLDNGTDGSGSFGISRADSDKIRSILGVMSDAPKGAKPGTFGAFDPTRGAKPFIVHTHAQIRELQRKAR
ncbi:MAG: hypothetical protein ABJE95_32550 [Byssovorax sp.]